MKDMSKESAINIIFDTHFNRPFDISFIPIPECKQLGIHFLMLTLRINHQGFSQSKFL